MTLRYRDFLIACLIIFGALGLRIVVLVDRYNADPQFSKLPIGSDQVTYVSSAQAYEVGLFPQEPFRYQPGFIYFLVGIRKFVGSNLVVDRLALIATDALACGCMIAVGWLLTRRRWGGFLTGIMYAIYPVAIFYSAEFLLEGLALFYICLFMFLALWQRERLTWWRTGLIGIVLGLVTITRTNLALMVVAWVLWLFLIEANKRRVFGHVLLSFLMLALVIAPVTLWNFQMGSRQLITNVGVDEIHRASSRDSDGTYNSIYNARRMVEGDYAAALLNDIQRDPLHFVAIQVRKLGLYWSNAEPANNIDYLQNGKAVSPLLQAIPLDFRIISLFGLLGTVVLWRSNRSAGLFFAAIHLLIFTGVMVIWVISRVRLPAVAPLIATSAYFFVWLVEQVRTRPRLYLVRKLAPAALAIIALLIFCTWAIDNALVKHPMSALPEDAHPSDIIFDQSLHLVGWRWFNEWSSAERGWAQPMQSYGVELFWEILKPTENDYNVYVAYIQDSVRYIAHDAVIGEVSFPPLPTSLWEPGEIYSEIMGFKFPHGIPSAVTGNIHLGVYRSVDDITASSRQVYGVAITSDPFANSDVLLQSMAVFDPGISPEIPSNLTEANLDFAHQVMLKNYRISQENGMGIFEFEWQALSDIKTDYILFIHIMDANNQLQASYDLPVGGKLLSSNWQPNYSVYERIPIELPTTPASYQIYIGLYDPVTQERLSVDAPDYRPLLGEITIEGND